MLRSTPLRLLAGLALLLGIAFSTGSLGANDSLRHSLKEKAKKAEERGAWLEACRCYDELVRKSKGETSVREEFQKAYQRCLRRLQMFARNSDQSYRQTIARLKFNQALATYEEVVKVVNVAYPDRGRAELAQLFQQGLNEVLIALDDSVFKQHYLADVKQATLNTFKNRLTTWPITKFARAAEVREQVRLIIGQAAKDGMPVSGALGNALVMEFAAGACNTLDEYSSFLTPTHLSLMQGAARKSAGAGLSVVQDGDTLRITNVWPSGPAADKGLKEGDRILSIGDKTVKEWRATLSFDELEAKFRGDADKILEIEYESSKIKQTAELKFRAVSLPSVQTGPPLDDGIAYIRINYFTEDTAREFKDALGGMMSSSIKALVLDLRGNPGGVFTSAVQIAELFLSEGVISVGQSTHPNFNRTFKVESPGALQMPLVVLVDGDTASAAEVLASALKESRTSGRTTIMGQTTFGKGSVQCLIELKKAPLDKMAGIRLTVAKLFTPSNVPITGKGVTPDKPLGADVDAKLAAKVHLLDLLKASDMLAQMMEPSTGNEQPVPPS